VINKQMRQFPWIYTTPVNGTIFGWGAYETVADECKNVGIKNALITTTGLKGTGIVDEINQILTSQGISTTIFDKVTSNPKDHEIMAAYAAFKEAQCDGVVSVGGGSSHDCGKGLRAVAANDGKDINNFAAFLDKPLAVEAKKYKPVTLPQVAVNTTAGTGAEGTGAIAFTSTKLRAKLPAFVPGITCTLSIIDPLLIRLMPKNITAWAGFDALTHAFETYVSRFRSPYVSAISLGMIEAISKNLREFTHNRMNDVACESMCWAAHMGVGTCAFGSGAGIVHGIGHQLSALTDCHHGRANAVVTPTVERFNEPSTPDRFAEMAKAMGVDTRGMTKMQAADKWFDEIERLLADLDIKPGHLSEQFGFKKEDVEHIVKIYSNDFCQEGNPRTYDYEETYKLVESML
jgi:alcohol dehydrogenase class IV